MPILRFINDNDAFLYKYFHSGATSTKEYKVFHGAVKEPLQYDAYPEPYYGNPYESLAVIININPGDAMPSSPFVGDYYSYAKGFPYLKGGGSIAGQKWWPSRYAWMQRLVKMYNGATALSSKMPFALEICPWHSQRWSGMKLTQDVKAYVRDRVLVPAAEAIQYSQLGFGLCVSKQVCDYLLACGATVVVNEKVWTPQNISGWPKNSKGNDISRCYCLLSYNDSFFLCTWAQGGNRAPGSAFEPVEADIIRDIKNRLQNP